MADLATRISEVPGINPLALAPFHAARVDVDSDANAGLLLAQLRRMLGSDCDRLLLDWLGEDMGWTVCAWNKAGDLLIPEGERDTGERTPARAVAVAIVALHEARND